MPVAWAAASVWQPMQPADVKIFAPAVGSPLSFDAGVDGRGRRRRQGADDGDRGGADDAFGAAGCGEEHDGE